MRLIDAHALNGYKFGLISTEAQKLFHETINNAPTVEIRTEQKVGHWIEHNHGLGVVYYQCSICQGYDDGIGESRKGRYCKWCGARMVDKEINNG